MELDCGGNKGGWMRIADIDTSRGDICPSGWNNYNNSYCTGGSLMLLKMNYISFLYVAHYLEHGA